MSSSERPRRPVAARARESPRTQRVRGLSSGLLLQALAVVDGLAEGEHLDRRTSIVILGDGRSNGKGPSTDALTEIARRVRRIVWLTPEPSYSWGLGACDLPEYAELCERVEVVRDLTGLERTAEKLALP